MILAMRRALLAAASGLALIALAPAQQQLVRELDSKLASLSVGSVAWYQTSLDRVAALWRYDLRATAIAGEQLWQKAKDSGPLGVAEAAAARVAIALTESEGANAAAVWVERATEPPMEADARIRSDYFLTRARNLCMLDKHSEELPLAIKSQGCAEEGRDWIRRVEALMVTIDSLPNRGLSSVRRLVREAEDAGAKTIRYLQPAIMVERAGHLEDRGDFATATQELDRAEALAVEHGNRTVLAEISLARARIADADGDVAAYEKWLVQAGERFASMHDLFGVVLAVDLRAELMIADEQLGRAQELIAEELRLMDGRGWSSLEYGVLITQRNFATKEEDGTRIAELSAKIAEIDVEEHKESVRFNDIAEELTNKELARAEMARELNAQRLEFAEQSKAIWMWGAFAGAIGIGAVVLVSWIGRRRLLLANRQLAEKIEQVDEARAAQSHLEERMQQMQRTEGLGTLAAGIAHDFNNLLTSMISGAELLRVQEDGSERRKLVDMILSAGQQGSRLCRQLQAYSGGAPLRREAFDLRQVILEMLPTLASSAKGELDVHLEPDSVRTVALVDRGQFEQILLNLVLNSHEAGAGNVWIRIRAGQADDGEGSVAVLRIRDDGPGMSESVAKRIFDPFFTTKFPGRGLGLAVVFGGVRRHGGQVSVASPDEGGACFTIHLPLAEKDVVLPAPPAKVPASAPEIGIPESVAVVVVDDESIVRVALLSMLRKLGIQATGFEDGRKAIDHVRALPATKACIALVDLTMPAMDGTEVIRQLRETGRPVSCILMSGHADDYVDECARQLQPDRLLSKPFMMGEVRQVVTELAARLDPVS